MEQFTGTAFVKLQQKIRSHVLTFLRELQDETPWLHDEYKAVIKDIEDRWKRPQ